MLEQPPAIIPNTTTLTTTTQFTKGKIHVFTSSLRAPREGAGRNGTTPKQQPIDSQAHMFKVLSALFTAASAIQGANSNTSTPAAAGDNVESDGQCWRRSYDLM